MGSTHDEYEYLERQLDTKSVEASIIVPDSKTARIKPAGGTVSDDDNNRKRRSRSRSRSKRHKSSRSSRSCSGSRERRRRSRSRSRDRSRSYADRYRSSHRAPPSRRSETPPSERMAREKERELRELERATRTIFAYNLNLRADERDLFEFFSKVGRVVDIRLITDKNTKKSRGLAYIEFSKVEEVISAVALTGNTLKGQPILVKASEAEKNMAWEAAQQQKQSTQAAQQQLLNSLASATGSAGPKSADAATAAVAGNGPCWLQIGNLLKELGEAEVQQLFTPFGKLEAVQVVRDAAGRSTGVAFLRYGQMDAAAGAMAHWHGRKLMDQQLTVTATAPPSTSQLLAPALPAAAAAVPGLLPSQVALMPAGDLLPGVAAVAPAAITNATVAPSAGAVAAVTAAQSAVVTMGELDEDNEGGGIKMSAQSRVALMSKLAGSAGLPLPAPHTGVTPAGVPLSGVAAAVDPVLLMQQGVLGPGSPIATPCLLLKNMFDATPSAGDAAAQGTAATAVAAEVEADVREECLRFGELVHVWVDPKSRGFVYLRFATMQSAEAAHKALHRRWYGGRQILAEYQFLQVYNSHFRLQAK